MRLASAGSSTSERGSAPVAKPPGMRRGDFSGQQPCGTAVQSLGRATLPD